MSSPTFNCFEEILGVEIPGGRRLVSNVRTTIKPR